MDALLQLCNHQLTKAYTKHGKTDTSNNIIKNIRYVMDIRKKLSSLQKDFYIVILAGSKYAKDSSYLSMGWYEAEL